MRLKLRLDLDQLAVDSFDTAAAHAEKGTVFGEQCTCPTACTCPGCPTCDHTACLQETCVASCEYTCAETCATCTSHKYTNCDGICY
jgi:hypothetical protein